MKTKASSSSVDNYLQSQLALTEGNLHQRRAAYMTNFLADSVRFEKTVFTHIGGPVDKVHFLVIASDQRERGNLILQATQRIEIATPTCGGFAMTLTEGFSTLPGDGGAR